jgi:putative redox protein
MPSVIATSTATSYAAALVDDLGNEWLADEPVQAGGGNAGPSPERLLLSSLAACTVITLRMYAQRRGWPLERVEVDVQLNPEGTPADDGTELRRTIALTGALSAEQQQRLLQVANACPLHKLLSGAIRIATRIGETG